MDKPRLSKLMAERGICSRREADRFIELGLVSVDGERVNLLGTRVDPGCVITLDDSAVTEQNRLVTILLNKPVGYVSAQPEKGYLPAVSLITSRSRFKNDRSSVRFTPAQLKGLAPAGRLDIDSQGLLVFTQDGRIARQLIGEKADMEKEYLVRYEGMLSDEALKLLNHGLSLDGKPLKPAKVFRQNREQLRFILKEGKKRQIRRMCEQVGIRVTGLKRIRIGKIELGNLPEGQWRYLAGDETF
ncbi:MAG: rRNA pseudouridine synthase [Nitrospirota bacterium]|nr:rRNA pseudouridine synthase [Nitrospirota bacterium]